MYVCLWLCVWALVFTLCSMLYIRFRFVRYLHILMLVRIHLCVHLYVYGYACVGLSIVYLWHTFLFLLSCCAEKLLAIFLLHHHFAHFVPFFTCHSIHTVKYKFISVIFSFSILCSPLFYLLFGYIFFFRFSALFYWFSSSYFLLLFFFWLHFVFFK